MSRQQGGGSMMVWVAFGSNGKTEIVFIKDALNALGYQTNLAMNLIPILGNLAEYPVVFQQDNAPVH